MNSEKFCTFVVYHEGLNKQPDEKVHIERGLEGSQEQEPVSLSNWCMPLPQYINISADSGPPQILLLRHFYGISITWHQNCWPLVIQMSSPFQQIWSLW